VQGICGNFGNVQRLLILTMKKIIKKLRPMLQLIVQFITVAFIITMLLLLLSHCNRKSAGRNATIAVNKNFFPPNSIAHPPPLLF